VLYLHTNYFECFQHFIFFVNFIEIARFSRRFIVYSVGIITCYVFNVIIIY